MNRLINAAIVVLLLAIMPLKQWAQTPYRQYAEDGILLNFHEIDNVDFRVFLLYNLTQDNRFILIANEEPGQFSISLSEEVPLANLHETFDTFFHNIYADFGLLSKTDISNLISSWKDCILPQHFLSITLDIALRNSRPVNNHCVDSDPFCTSDVITFDAATTSQTADQLEGTTLQDGCIGSSYNPSWFHMRIQTGGQFIIHVEGHDPNNGTNRDVDFCMWGPYTDPTSPCVAQLTTNKIIDCSFSAAYFEDIFLGYQSNQHYHGSSGTTDHGTVNYHLPVAGEYYILMITNYSRQPCTISFTKTPNSGPGETDCGILPGIANNDGPYCVGETIHLTVNAQEGATYNWTGPGGFSSNQQNPTRPNCTMAMAGTYTCTTTVGSQSVTATTEVIIYPQPTANFTFTSVCMGEPTQFTSTSTTNPSGQQITSYLWDFGDGQTSTQQNPSHLYPSARNYQVTLTVSCGNGLCTSSKTQTVTVYAAPVANAGPDQFINYGSSAQLSGSGGSGTFSFHWEPANMVNNPDAQNTQTVPLTQDQTYTLTVTNSQGECSSTDEVTIHISGSAMAVIPGPDISICQGGSGQIYVNAGGGTGNFSYSWTPTTGLNDPNIYNPVASPSQTTTYNCLVTDGQTSQNVSVTVTVNDVIVENEYATICPDDVYLWHGSPYASVGTYQFDTVTSQGCDKTIYLHLDHYPTYDETMIDTAICFGESFVFYGTSYSSSIQTSHTDHSIHGCDSIVRLNLTVYSDNGVTPHPVTVCPEQLPYHFYGVDYYDETDVTVLDSDIHGCDSLVRLILTISDHFEPPTVHKYVGYYDSPSYNWYIPEANTTLTYTEDGLYTETLPTSSCEGIFTLDLHFLQIPETVLIDTTVCDRFDWYVKGTLVDSYSSSCDQTYNIPLCYEPYNLNTQYMYYDPANPNNPIPCVESHVLHLTVNHQSVNNPVTFDGIQNNICDVFAYYNPNIGDTLYFYDNTAVTLDGQTPQGCDYKVQLKINNMQYTPHPVIDCSDLNVPNPHWPITATEFNVNRYTYQVTDEVSDITRWDMNQSKWEISKESWRIVPNPSGSNPLECMVYAMDWVPDSIRLSFKAVNSCSGDEGVVAEYWLHPSFYGVEEQEAYPAAVSVSPNPNNGQMQLRFENMEGSLDIKVYSLTGILVDAFALNVKTGETHEYSMKRLMNGIYFFTISDGKRSVTRKVVVIH